jgi:hypothetical protein
LVIVLLSSLEEDFCQFPRQWLDRFMNQITAAGASITRRSAGLPMAILSIAGRSPKGRKLYLDKVILNVFEIAQSKIIASKDNVDLPQVHAMNIIKIIIQDSEINEETRKYIPEAFEICIMAFLSDYFPMRNCAAQLFAVLAAKTVGFGVFFTWLYVYSNQLKMNRIPSMVESFFTNIPPFTICC